MQRRGFLATITAVGIAGCTSTHSDQSTTTTANAPSVIEADGGLVTASLTHRETHGALEYYDESTDSLQDIEPTAGEWVWAIMWVENNGGDKLMIDTIDDLRCDGVSETKSLPIPEGSLRESIPAPRSEMETRGEYIPAGYRKPIRFLFDAPMGPHSFVWTYDDVNYPISPKK